MSHPNSMSPAEYRRSRTLLIARAKTKLSEYIFGEMEKEDGLSFHEWIEVLLDTVRSINNDALGQEWENETRE